MEMIDRGNATINASTYITFEFINNTGLPVIHSHTGKNIDEPSLMNNAQNRYEEVPTMMLIIAASFLGFLEYNPWANVGNRAAAVIPINKDVAFAIISPGIM